MIRSTLLLLAGCCVVSLPNGQPPTPPAAGALVVHQILPDVLRPVRVAYDPRGNLLVLSEGDNALEIYDTRLQLVKRIGRLGSAPGELYRPTDFALCPDGTIWIAERGNGRLEKFSPDGKVQQKIDTAEPVSIAIGPEGSLAVVGARDADLVKLYRAGGQYLRSAGEYVDVPGATDFQKRSFNKGRVFAMPEGFVYMYSFVAESLMRQYTWAGALIREWRPDGFGMDNARTKAKARQAGSIASGGSGARSMLNGLDVDEKRRAIWIAPAASALYVYGYDGAKLAEHRLQDSGGQTYGAHDVAISPDSKTLTFVSGAFLMQTSLSDALNGKGVDR